MEREWNAMNLESKLKLVVFDTYMHNVFTNSSISSNHTTRTIIEMINNLFQMNWNEIEKKNLFYTLQEFVQKMDEESIHMWISTYLNNLS